MGARVKVFAHIWPCIMITLLLTIINKCEVHYVGEVMQVDGQG